VVVCSGRCVLETAPGLRDTETSTDCILKQPATLELVLTGRNPDPVFLEAADYVSEIHGVRHPYQKQIPARKGIEF
uniref:cob(I)yrinic acid a,c-diamide adenosyltransferase n=1 Tax=Eisenbergiella sp. TaxID=1924109 RepID=UPI003FF01C75